MTILKHLRASSRYFGCPWIDPDEILYVSAANSRYLVGLRCLYPEGFFESAKHRLACACALIFVSPLRLVFVFGRGWPGCGRAFVKQTGAGSSSAHFELSPAVGGIVLILCFSKGDSLGFARFCWLTPAGATVGSSDVGFAFLPTLSCKRVLLTSPVYNSVTAILLCCLGGLPWL